jgi:peroxiredoxin
MNSKIILKNKFYRMNKSFLIILLFIKLTSTATIIEIHSPEYSGEELRFFRYSDPVTKNKILSFSLQIDQNGDCKEDIPVNNTTFLFCDFGIYRGMLFLEPGNDLQLVMPPVREKSFADRKNPFFNPVEFWFSTSSKNSLTDKISSFDKELNRLTNKFFNQLYFRQSKNVLDSISVYLDQKFNSLQSETFLFHKKLKLKSAETDVLRLDASKSSELLSSVSQKFYEHPAFLELFDKIYSNKLSFEAKSPRTNMIRKAVSSANSGFLIDFIKNNYHLTGILPQLALIKMLHDGFYSNDFPKDPILKMLASETLLGNANDYIREVSLNVIKKLNFLRAGTKAPSICLKNTNGNLVCTHKKSGKFKYIIFADTEMVICREQLKYLKEVKNQFNEFMEIAVILKKTNIIEMKIFLDKQEIPGIHLVDGNEKYIELYKVRSFPTAFLLNENHEVVFNQTKTPLDGFIQQFGTLIRANKASN